ncbi:MAG TPA: FHA domain-containing protein [Leptolyngbyaceae cyanobacterium M33_DOE_097]|nr:FHA domain-containing protein [Leptolyngbyaceae cyanobacterium M33_DOE_097]
MVSLVKKQSRVLDLIQELKNLITENLSQEDFYQVAIDSIDAAANYLNLKTPSISLISLNLDLAKSFHSFVKDLICEDCFQFCFQELPASLLKGESANSPFLTLYNLNSELEDTDSKQFPLVAKTNFKVGRKSDCDIHIPDYCSKVSGEHLNVYMLGSNEPHQPLQWCVQESQTCRNGTFINGQKLLGTHVLKHGDRLVLGDQLPSIKSPELVFECCSNPDQETFNRFQEQFPLSVVTCDILCVVIKADEYNASDKEVLNRSIGTLPFQGCFLVLLNEKTGSFSIFQYPDELLSSMEFSQSLSHYSQHDEYVQFQQALVKVNCIIDLINELTVTQLARVNEAVRKAETQLTQTDKRRVTDRRPATAITINEQKVWLLKSVETSLTQSKQDLLDDSLADSIIQKIQDLVSSLRACVVKQGTEKYLELNVQDSDLNVNDYLFDFCKRELLNWAEEEWRNICTTYGHGGLDNLRKNINGSSALSSEQKQSITRLTEKQRNHLEDIFQVPLKRINCRVAYREDPILLYFIKKVRSSIFQVMGILFLLSFLGFSRGAVIKSINKQISGSFLLTAIALSLIGWLLYKLYRNYQKDKGTEVQKASEKLRQELQGYYQRVIKGRFADKLVQSLKVFLQEEIDRCEEKLMDTHSEANDVLTSRDKQESTKIYLRECQSQATRMERIIRDLQRLKGKLQRLQVDN